MKVAIAIVSVLLALVSVELVLALDGPADGPRICVQELKSGRKFPIHVKLNQTVLDTKRTIRNQLDANVPPEYQELKFNGLTLDDEQTLEHYNIGRHSQVGVIDHTNGFHQKWDDITWGAAKQNGPGVITIHLWTSGAASFSLDVHLDDTIAQVKEKIFQQEEYPVADLKLFFQGQLEDSTTVRSYGLQEGDLIKFEAPLIWCFDEPPHHNDW